ncbi:MAG TPA: histidine kinase [Solirubrobacterales bacterium]|nr:histidine kinase [Solirubrobacterales bacterium]
MNRWTRIPSLQSLAAPGASFLASAAFFLAIAAAIPLRSNTVLIVLWCLICVAVLIAAAKRGGPLYGVPMAIATGLAFDSFYIPPTRAFGPSDWQNFLIAGMYIGLGVLVGSLAELTRRQAEVSEAGRSKLAEEQTALRRVATLVARGVEPSEVFSSVALETRDLLGADATIIACFEPDATARIVAATGPGAVVGERWPLEAGTPIADVQRSGRPGRADQFRPGVAVTTPVVVGGRLWGATLISSRRGLPTDTERRLAEFTELVAIAIANAEDRAELKASRARIVAATDESRRQIERDLHDGVQQRLVSLALAMRAAEPCVPSEQTELRLTLSQTVAGLNDALAELREISRGIHPAILSQGGLATALRTLARRSRVPVEVTVAAEGPLPAQLEVAVYYVVAEALANIAKHARAESAWVDLERSEAALRLHVRDDGVGGADPARGSGLIGLSDRVQAVGGAVTVDSPPGGGTCLKVTLPIGPTP